MIYLGLFLLSFILTYLIKKYALKKSLVAKVTDRSSHTSPTPHGGGIALAFSWFLGISYLFYMSDIDSSLYYALMCGLLLSIVSYMDDLFELSARIRLLTQAFVSILGLYFLGGLQTLDLLIFSIDNQILSNSIGFFLIVWFINLYNFLDGIDGYAASEAVFLALAGFLLFGGEHFLVLAASALGFLVWNWDKAKIFMGDVGSTLLGYNIAVLTIYYANYESQNIWIWMILFGVFVFDATLTLFRRYKNGENLSVAHKKHAYQRLTQAGWSHQKVVVYSIFVNCILFFLIYNVSSVLAALLISIIFLYSIIRYIDSKKAFE
ncbi:glycosyltransferase family 4 protein [bacterium]|nr:glycosyltransferase family 4 protein [bacterium]